MRLILFLVVLLVFQASALRAETTPEDAIRVSINRTFAEIEITSIKKSQVEGLYEVLIGPDLIYASRDGRYIFQGDLIDLKQKRNMSEEIRSSVRSEMLENIPANQYIEYAPQKREHTIYVFTDIDCGYCRRLHRDMPVLNKRGVAVRYLAFPRAGVDSKTAKQMQAVWCAADRNKAMNEAKQGMRVSETKCDNPVSRQFELGREMGVQGTPAIYTERGQHLSGYLPPDKLIQALRFQ